MNHFKEAADFLKKRPHAFFLMELSLLPEQVKLNAIDMLCDRFSLPEGCKKLCLLLIKDQRISLLHDIFIFILLLREKDLKIMHFKLSSSVELSDSQKKQIEQFLDKQIDGSIDCVYRIDTSLIAGIRLQSRSLLWEQSVKKRLRVLQESLR